MGKTLEIKQTSNYQWFKMFANNRPISNRHLEELREQFQLYGNITEVSPITVNNNGFIFDGQHRRILCQEFGFPVNYIERDAKVELTPAMNHNQKQWEMLDYIRFFADLKSEYKILSRFISDNSINFSIASAVLWPEKGRSWVASNVVRGTIEVSGVIEEAQKRMDIISELGEIMGDKLTERYTRGILKSLYLKDFDIERFMNKAKTMMRSSTSRLLVTPRATTNLEVMRNIELIYNFHAQPSKTVILFR